MIRLAGEYQNGGAETCPVCDLKGTHIIGRDRPERPTGWYYLMCKRGHVEYACCQEHIDATALVHELQGCHITNITPSTQVLTDATQTVQHTTT